MTSNIWEINYMNMTKKLLLYDQETTVIWLIKIKHCSFEYNINDCRFFVHEMTEMRLLAKSLDWHVVTWVEWWLWHDWLRFICFCPSNDYEMTVRWLENYWEMTLRWLGDNWEMTRRFLVILIFKIAQIRFLWE